MKPNFYLKVMNGYSISFGIIVYLDSDRKHELFSTYTNGNYDNRKDLFERFVINENLGLLNFTFDIYHEDSYINMRWATESEESRRGGNAGRQDCRNWIWDCNKMRNRIQTGGEHCGGNVITRNLDFAKGESPKIPENI